MFHHLLAQSAYNSSSQSEVNPVILIVYLAIVITIIVGMWKMYQKAGRPGWATLVPFYNNYTLVKIAGKPGWWLLLLMIPIVNIYFTIVIGIEVARRFGRSTLFGSAACGLFGVGYIVLGFNDDKYTAIPDQTEAA